MSGNWSGTFDEVLETRDLALGMGGAANIERQHRAGRLTIRERFAELLDEGSFAEIGVLAGSRLYDDNDQPQGFIPASYLCGLGKIHGRSIVVGGEDFTARGGSDSGAGMKKRGFAEKMSREYRIPLVLLADHFGADVAAYPRRRHSEALPNGTSFFPASVELLGMVPVVAAVMGSVAGGPAGRVILAHWTCMVKGTSEVFAAGPPVVRRSVGTDISKQELGGSQVHTQISGSIHNEAETELECLRMIRQYLSYMPSNAWEAPPFVDSSDPIDRRDQNLFSIIPQSRRRSYDMRALLRMVVDDGELFEIQPMFGRSLITCLARIGGHVVGITANDPRVIGGALDADSAEKLAHFLEVTDFFHIPQVQFVDVPGFMVGREAEEAGTLKSGMRAFWMASQSTVPRVTIMVRKCYGMGGALTGNPNRLNLRLAWPSAEWGSIPIEGGVDAAFRKEIANAPDPAQRRAELEAELNSYRSPLISAEAFDVEDIIDPRDTRPLIGRFLETALPSYHQTLGPKPLLGVRP